MDFSLTDEEEKRIIDFKRDMHMHPELSHEEFETTKKIKKFLSEIPGMVIIDIPTKTGVLAVLPCENCRQFVSSKEGISRTKNGVKTIGLRCDIDAIRQTEKYDTPYRSKTEGVMHACGHDFHTASLLGAALILSKQKESLSGNVAFLFQEAEETTNGMQEMIDDGLLKLVNPDMFFGLHNWPLVPAGKVILKKGALMAAKTNFVINIRGQGGHGSMPHLCVDPIVCAAAVISSLQTVVSRNTDPLESVVLSVGSINGGSVENLVVDEVKMTASIRSLSMDAKEIAIRHMEMITENTCRAFGCTCSIEYKEVLPVTYNTPDMYDIAKEATTLAVGKDCITDTEPTLASEDFSIMMEKVPSFLYWFGSATEGKERYPLHSCMFHADDQAIKTAANVLAASVFAALDRKG